MCTYRAGHRGELIKGRVIIRRAREREREILIKKLRLNSITSDSLGIALDQPTIMLVLVLTHVYNVYIYTRVENVNKEVGQFWKEETLNAFIQITDAAERVYISSLPHISTSSEETLSYSVIHFRKSDLAR